MLPLYGHWSIISDTWRTTSQVYCFPVHRGREWVRHQFYQRSYTYYDINFMIKSFSMSNHVNCRWTFRIMIKNIIKTFIGYLFKRTVPRKESRSPFWRKTLAFLENRNTQGRIKNIEDSFHGILSNPTLHTLSYMFSFAFSLLYSTPTSFGYPCLRVRIGLQAVTEQCSYVFQD